MKKAFKTGDRLPELKGVKWLLKADKIGAEKLTGVTIFSSRSEICTSIIPDMNKVQKKYKDLLAVAAVTDEDQSTVDKFLSGKGSKIEYTVGILPAKTYSSLHIDSYPQMFLIDGERNILWEGHPIRVGKFLDSYIHNAKEGFNPKTAAQDKKKIYQSFGEIEGRLSRHLTEKAELRSRAAQMLQIFPDDGEMDAVVNSCSVRVPGEIFEEPKEAEWLGKKQGTFGKMYTAVSAFSLGQPGWMNKIPYLSRIQTKHSGKVSVFSLVYVPDKAAGKSEGIEKNFQDLPIGKVDHIVYTRYISEIYDNLGETVFILDKNRKILWKGHTFDAEKILERLVSGELKEPDLLAYAGMCEDFEAIPTVRSYYSIKSAEFKKIKSEALKILKIMPDSHSILTHLVNLSLLAVRKKACTKQEAEKVCADINIENFSSGQLCRLLGYFHSEYTELFPPKEFSLRLFSQAVKLEPNSADNLRRCIELLPLLKNIPEIRDVINEAVEQFSKESSDSAEKRKLKDLLKKKSGSKK
ncbi:MAG TPA: hypothetical protein PL048_00130 [Leptospiraceae bacterium]|nr:hypothetical protein [Leptospiraceae bacterium]